MEVLVDLLCFSQKIWLADLKPNLAIRRGHGKLRVSRRKSDIYIYKLEKMTKKCILEVVFTIFPPQVAVNL